MKLKYDFYFQHIGDVWAGVPVGKDSIDFEYMLHLNEVGHDIVEMLSADTTRENIIQGVLDTYDAERDEVEYHVDKMLAYLTEQGLVV